MTKSRAKKYCLIKYDRARKTGCTQRELHLWLEKYYKKISKFPADCGYCKKYISCMRCPLKGKDVCNNLYWKWVYAKTIEKRKKYADQIYEIIKRS